MTNKFTPKVCNPSSLTPIYEKSEIVGYKDDYYTYMYKKEGYGNNYKVIWKDIEADGYGVALNSDIVDSVTEINESPCSMIDTKAIVSTSYMYYNAEYLSKIDFSHFDTSNVVNMKSMFHFTGSSATLFSIDVSNFNTLNVTNMSDMFILSGFSASIWEIGDVSNWNTSNVTNMETMFLAAGFYSSTFDVSGMINWDTSKVEIMNEMFGAAGNSASYTLDLSKWKIDSVESCPAFNAFVDKKVTPPACMK